MKPNPRTLAKSSRRAAALAFLLFGFIALAIVVTLEFLDQRAGRYSFIFSKVVPLRQKAAAGESFGRDLTALLGGQKIAYDMLRDRSGVVHFKIDLAEPQYVLLVRELRRLVEARGGLQLLSEVQGMKEHVVYLYQVSFGKRLTHIILLNKRLALKALAEGAAPAGPPPGAPAAKGRPGAKAPAGGGTPRLAIIIDDIGYADLVSDQLRALGIPITGAVIPDAPYARSEAQRLHVFGLEEIVHLPMQPKDPANHHPRDQFILIDSSDAEIETILERALAAVPHARGVNNHMGSLLTADQPAMRRVLGLLKERRLFFVDSKTATDSVAYAVARALKVRTALRDVFLDDTQGYEYSLGQIQRLVGIARAKGRALAIGHPFPSTLAALRDAVPWLKKQEVALVPVSELLE